MTPLFQSDSKSFSCLLDYWYERWSGGQVVVKNFMFCGTLIIYTGRELFLPWERRPLIGQDVRLQGIVAQIYGLLFLMVREVLLLYLVPRPIHSYCWRHSISCWSGTYIYFFLEDNIQTLQGVGPLAESSEGCLSFYWSGCFYMAEWGIPGSISVSPLVTAHVCTSFAVEEAPC